MFKIKSKSKKTILVSFIVFSSLVLFATEQINNCSTQTIFWGTSCCTGSIVYTDNFPGENITMPFTKCCKYRFGFVSSCDVTNGDVIIGSTPL